MLNVPKNTLGLETVPEATTYFGIVRYAFPWLNLYVVEPNLNGSIGKELRLVSGPDGSARMGEISHAYAVGDSVIVAQDADDLSSHSNTDYIIGHATLSNTQDTEGPSTAMVSVSGFASILSKVFDKLSTYLCGSLRMNSRKRYTTPQDMLCGDTNIGGAPGNNISVLKHITRIQCGKGCFIELDSILSRIRIVTEKMEYIGPLKSYQDMSGKGSLLEYNQTALTFEEGTLGLFDDTKRQPVFRKKDIAGDVTSGWQTAVSVPDINNSKSDDVYSSKVRYDGELSTVSAKGFEFKKSLNIVTPYLKESQEGFGTLYTEVEEFPDFTNNNSKSDESNLTNRSLTIPEDTSNRIETEHPRVSTNPDTWGISSDLRTEKLKKAIESTRALPSINDKQQYDLPDTVELKDPHTGKTYTYFKSDSGFRYEPDGSVVLYDGYGSEIRMTRGNIIISAAADVILRPGRDLHAMVGGHLALVAQGNAILHSSNKDTYIKGNRNVSILSGLNKTGKTIVDNRGDGILIKSATKASLVATDVFVGSVPKGSTSNSTSASKGSGTVTIGGGTNTLVTGERIAVYGEYIDNIAHKDGEISWVSIDPNRVVCVSNSNYISGETYIGHISGTLTATIGSGTISAGNQNKRSHLYLQANMDACYNISCRNLWAEQVMGVRVAAGNAHRSSGIKATISKPSINSTAPKMSQAHTINVLYGGPWSDSFNISTGFTYPTSAELGIPGNTYTIPGILWQKYLKSGKVWSETPIPDVMTKDKTYMVYPGAEAWEGTINMGVDSDVSLKGGYKINGRN